MVIKAMTDKKPFLLLSMVIKAMTDDVIDAGITERAR